LSDDAGSSERNTPRPLRLATGIGSALVVGILVGALGYRALSDDDPENLALPTKPVASSVADLRSFATTIGHPVYWAGALPSHTYELRLTKLGRIFVRYLPRGVKVGDRRASFLTVATYPVDNAVRALRRTAGRGGVGVETGQGGFVYYDPSKPRSVYYARLSTPNYEVEVFDPSPRRARALVLASRIQPVK
jgi:hypothetical protein